MARTVLPTALARSPTRKSRSLCAGLIPAPDDQTLTSYVRVIVTGIWAKARGLSSDAEDDLAEVRPAFQKAMRFAGLAEGEDAVDERSEAPGAHVLDDVVHV